MVDDELAHFQRSIDLPALATAYGWQRDARESTARSVVLRRADGGKLVVSTAQRGGWLFFDARTGRHGNAIDFLHAETGQNLGHIRRQLRAWSGASKPTFFFPTEPKTLTESPASRLKAAEVWNLACWLERPPALAERGLDAALNDPRFADCWRVDKDGTVLFPHHDEEGLCGLELRRLGWKAFTKNTTKGLWASKNMDHAKTIFITESPIDCLAHCELYGWNCAYVALGGNPSQKQKALLQELFGKTNREILVGVDSDEAGFKLASMLNDLANHPLERWLPVGKDWAEDLEYCYRERS